jgi:hypothetical protein
MPPLRIRSGGPSPARGGVLVSGCARFSGVESGARTPETKETMKFRILLTALALAGFRADAGAPAPTAEWLAGVSSNGLLVMFPSDDPFHVTRVKVKGLKKKERILAVDVRPATGQLYALGSTSRLYTVNWETGQATEVGDGPFTPALAGQSFSFDFNPTVDRIRIMSNAGQNLRAHPDTGAIVFIDAGLAYAGGDPGFASAPGVVACAYTNSDTDPATGTTLYDLDATRDTLVLQDPPNAGTLNTVGPLGVNATRIAGFDIAGSDGTAYAAMVVKKGRFTSLRTGLFTIDLATGDATFLGNIGGPWRLTSLTALGPVVEAD